MCDVAGKVPKPSNIDDPAPDFFESIWDDPHITKLAPNEENPRGSVYCHWCNCQFRIGYNVVKVLSHVSRSSGHSIKACLGNIRADYDLCYQTMNEMKQTKAARHEAAKFSYEKLQDRRDSAALEATRMKRHVTKDKASAPLATPKGETSKLTQWLSSSARSSGGSGGKLIQSKIGSAFANREGDEVATNHIVRLVLCTGLSHSLVEVDLFR